MDSGEAAESWDIYATMFGGIPQAEINALKKYWDAFPNLKEALFVNTSEEMAALREEVSVTEMIANHPDTLAFVQQFQTAFADFDEALKNRLIAQISTLNVPKTLTEISADMFSRLQSIPLIDRYEAYQLLDDDWQIISGDLEILQTESLQAAKQVDANLVIKKVKGKETEVQEGWKGHIFPFELVQKVYLQKELAALSEKENRLAEIAASYEELLESISEEGKDSDITNESKDAFVNAEIIKKAKEILADQKKGATYGDDDDETKILQVNALIAEEKTLKKETKEDADALHLLTKATIEKLSNAQVDHLLEAKWITPLVTALQQLPTLQLDALTQKVNYLATKYSTTLQEVSTQLQSTENDLATMMGELTGSDHDMQGLREWQKLLKTN